VRHYDIANDDVGRKRMGQGGAFCPIGSARDRVTFKFEQINQEFKDSLVVVDN
jgi:hypothetical protein